MSFEVEIYRCGDAGVRRVETRPLGDVLCHVLEPLLGRDLSGAELGLQLHLVPDSVPLTDSPTVENLMPDYGYATVIVTEDGVLTYRHPHRLQELFGRGLRDELHAAHPEVSAWGYRIVGPAVTQSIARRPPNVEGAVAVEPDHADAAPGIRRVDGPLLSLEAFETPAGNVLAHGNALANDGAGDEFVKVLVHPRVARDLEERRFSNDIEEGGFFVGRVFLDAEHDGTFLLEVTGALRGWHSGASLFQLTFTGDAFRSVERQLQARPGERLLGWYHTHLFPATVEAGLSTIDLELHFAAFRKPWQVAGLIHLEPGGGRTLRFYVRREDTMELCPHWILQRRGSRA